MPWPLEIRVSKNRNLLTIVYDDGVERSHSAETLRVHSPSAEVRGHGSSTRKAVTGKENIRIIEVEPIGNYAVRLVFDDGHKTGLYSWDYLYTLDEGN